MTHYRETQFGFEYGSIKIARLFSDEKKGWVVLGAQTPRADFQIYATKTGKIRISDERGEWTPPAEPRQKKGEL